MHLTHSDETVPAFAIADYVERPSDHEALCTFPNTPSLARDYALAAEANDPLLHDWLGDPLRPVRVIELTDPTPIPSRAERYCSRRCVRGRRNVATAVDVHAGSARWHSPHPWIQEGMQRFLQLSVESHSGRKAALDYLNELREPLVKAEERPSQDRIQLPVRSKGRGRQTLLNTSDELYLRGKGSFVFWMLRDMVGDADAAALAGYRPERTKTPLFAAPAANQFQARPGVVLRRLGLSRSRAAGFSRGVRICAAAC